MAKIPFKLALIVFAIFLLASQQQSCEAGIIAFAETTITLGQFVYDMGSKFFEGPKTQDETSHLVETLNQIVTSDLKDIMKILNDLPKIIHFTLKQQEFNNTIRRIRSIFAKTVSIQQTILNGTIEHEKVYEKFSVYLEKLDDYMDTVRDIILNRDTMRDLIEMFTSDEQIYDSACKTGMSHFQLLHRFLWILKVTTAQYYMSSTLIYNFLDIHNAKPIYNVRKQKLTEKVQLEYKEAVGLFKAIMNSTSREIWSCDLRDYSEDARYTNRTDLEYYEMMAFQKFILNEKSLGTTFCKEVGGCSKIRKMEHCNAETSRFCETNRICKGGLYGCENLHSSNPQSSTTVCVDKDKNAQARYRGLVPKEKSSNLYCPENEALSMAISDVRHSSLDGMASDTCSYCGCVCEENQYWIYHLTMTSDSFANYVVTGARLRVVRNIIDIEIQQGLLLANGTINVTTVHWIPMQNYLYKYRYAISWDRIREINLGTVLLPANHVLTGFQFLPDRGKRLSLTGLSAEVDFATGKLKPVPKHRFSVPNYSKDAQEEIQLWEADVPTRYRKQNYPVPDNNKFVKFQLSSLAKDGGQTTIPFIDTQKVYTKPSLPLSGFGLILRRAKGYGGFLALKLYNYDVTRFIGDAFDLDNNFIPEIRSTVNSLADNFLQNNSSFNP